MSVKIEDNAKNREALDQHFQKSAEQGKEFEQVEALSTDEIRDFMNGFNEIKRKGSLLSIIGDGTEDGTTTVVLRGSVRNIVVSLAYAMIRDSRLSSVVTNALGLSMKYVSEEGVEFELDGDTPEEDED